MSRRSYLPAKDLRPPLGTEKQEAAKFLRDMATDFLKERSGENVVTEAAREWLKVAGNLEGAPRDHLARQGVGDSPSRVATIDAILPTNPLTELRATEVFAEAFENYLKTHPQETTRLTGEVQ